MHEEVIKQDFSGLAQEKREGKDLQSACLGQLEPFTQNAGDMAQQLRTRTSWLTTTCNSRSMRAHASGVSTYEHIPTHIHIIKNTKANSKQSLKHL